MTSSPFLSSAPLATKGIPESPTTTTPSSRAPAATNAPERSERGCIRRITRSNPRTPTPPISSPATPLQLTHCDGFRRRNTVALRPRRTPPNLRSAGVSAGSPAATCARPPHTPSPQAHRFDSLAATDSADGIQSRSGRDGHPRTFGARVYPQDHPQQPAHAHRAHLLPMRTASTCLLRLIPRTEYSRAPAATDAPGRCDGIPVVHGFRRKLRPALMDHREHRDAPEVRLRVFVSSSWIRFSGGVILS